MQIGTTILLALTTCLALWAQSATINEDLLKKLPPDRQTYERFRYWISMQPVEVQRSPDALGRYRAELKRQGLSDAEADARINTIRNQGTRLEVERWNEILTSDKPRFNTKPNAFLVEMVKGRTPGKALDVGMGQGRNALWLAQQGWDVTGFDPAEKAVALANENAKKLGVKLVTEVKGSEDFNFGDNRWDLILMSYVTVRDIKDAVQRSLKPGGIVIIEAVHRDATKGNSIGGGVVFDTAELPTLFPALRTVEYREPMDIADFGLRKVRVVRFCAEKPVE